jgi:O-antigen ligase
VNQSGTSPESTALGRLVVAFGILIALALLVSRGISAVPVNLALAAAAGGAVFVLVFIRTDFGLEILLLSMLLSPEVILGGKGGVAEQREVSIRIDDFIILIIAFTWFAKNAVYKELGLVSKTPLNRPIAAYMGACALTTAWGMAFGHVGPLSGVFYLLKYLEYFFVYYITVNNVRTPNQARRLVVVALLTAAIVSVIGIGQIPSGQRVSAPFEGESGEPNTLGGYLVLMMAITAGLATETKRARVRLVGIGLVALMLIPFAYTLSRASYLAMIPATLLFVGVSSKRAFLVPTVVIGLLLVPYFAPKVVVERVQYTFKTQVGQPTVRLGQAGFDPSTSERLLSFKEAIGAWTTRPILGFGITGFRFMDAQYPRTLVETGVVGFLAFAWMIVSVFRLALGRYRSARDPYWRGLALGYLAGFVGLLFHAIGSNTFIIIRVMEPFWFFTGLLVLLPELESAPAHHVEAPRPPARPFVPVRPATPLRQSRVSQRRLG